MSDNNDNATKQDLREMEERLNSTMDAKLERLEANLLSAFHSWAGPTEIKVRGVISTTAELNQRLCMLEERMLNLEGRKSS